MDESYFLYSEETDFSLRAKDAGWATVYTPTAGAMHVGGGSGESASTHTMKIVNRVRLYRRRRGTTPGSGLLRTHCAHGGPPGTSGSREVVDDDRCLAPPLQTPRCPASQRRPAPAMMTSPVAPRMRLLLIAPACDGEDVGEAWVAFQWVQELSRAFDVTLLCPYKLGHTPMSRQVRGVRVVEWAEPVGVDRFERLNSLLQPGYVPFYVRPGGGSGRGSGPGKGSTSPTR